MKKILSIQSSPRGKASASIKLAAAIIDKLLVAYPGSTVETIDLVKTPFPHLEESHLNSFFTPEDQRSDEAKLAVRHSDENIKAIMESDILVIGAPMYNFGIHSTLKAWIDHIVRSGLTFRVSDTGAEGLVKGKKVYVAEVSGLVYTDGPMKAMDFVEPYLRTVLGFIGLTDITFVKAEGLMVPGLQETAFDKAVAAFQVN